MQWQISHAQSYAALSSRDTQPVDHCLVCIVGSVSGGRAGGVVLNRSRKFLGSSREAVIH